MPNNLNLLTPSTLLFASSPLVLHLFSLLLPTPASSPPPSSPASSPHHQDASTLHRLIKNRRSFFPKQYTGRPVPDPVVRRCLECARWAPSHGVTEGWRFVVFSGGKKDRLGRFLAEEYRRR